MLLLLLLEHQNPSKTSKIMGCFDRVDDRVTVSLHIFSLACEGTCFFCYGFMRKKTQPKKPAALAG